MAIDVSNYKPTSAADLGGELLNVAMAAAKDKWDLVKDNVANHMDFIASHTLQVSDELLAGHITRADANEIMDMLQSDLRLTLMQLKALPYLILQGVIDGVIGLAKAVIRNFTGVGL